MCKRQSTRRCDEMSSESSPGDQRKAPQIDVRLDLDVLDRAARERVERVIERSVSQELAKENERVLVQLPDIITIGIIAQEPPPPEA
jgi:hypothetical protein